MYNFILEITLMVSLGVMIYLVARAVPRISDEVPESMNGNKFERWISSLPLQKFDAAFSNFLEKFLRRFRLILMRLDNAVGGYLSRIKKLNNVNQKNGEEKPSLFTTNGNGNHRQDSSGEGNELK